MSRNLRRARGEPLFRGWRRHALQLLRLLVLALAFELSGTTAALANDAECDSSEASDCPLEREGKQCPPGCPQCHCAHVGMAAPVIAPLCVRASAPGKRVKLASPDSTVIPVPVEVGLYRPPRSR